MRSRQRPNKVKGKNIDRHGSNLTVLPIRFNASTQKSSIFHSHLGSKKCLIIRVLSRMFFTIVNIPEESNRESEYSSSVHIFKQNAWFSTSQPSDHEKNRNIVNICSWLTGLLNDYIVSFQKKKKVLSIWVVPIWGYLHVKRPSQKKLFTQLVITRVKHDI